MRRSSKIILAICAFFLVYFVMVYVQLSSQSRQYFTQKDADTFLSELAQAFHREDPNAVVSFAYPDATVAGQTLQSVRNLLHQGFTNIKDPQVTYQDMRLVNDTQRNMAIIQAKVNVVDNGAGGEVKYSAPVTFTLERRAFPHLLGLITVYDWKVVTVEARLPTESMLP